MNQDAVKRFDNLDGLRAFAAIGIVLMHVRANTEYKIGGYVYNTILPFLTNLVFLFMIISAFSVCCGYYEKFKNNSISIASFYEKRFVKILPFFALLVVAELIYSPSVNSLIEAFTDLTLCFGLLPNARISVIGVGWFIGIIFVFYFLFPFFSTVILKNKRRAWISLAITIELNIFCIIYFFDTNHVSQSFSPRSNIIFCAMFFVAGGIIYLYREALCKMVSKFWYIALAVSLAVAVAYFFLPKPLEYGVPHYLMMLLIFSCLVIYAIGAKSYVLNNPVTKFLSSISMEIYLCHMLVFRVAEKLKLNNLLGEGVVSYVFLSAIVLIGSIVFSYVVKLGFEKIGTLIKEKRKEKADA